MQMGNTNGWYISHESNDGSQHCGLLGGQIQSHFVVGNAIYTVLALKHSDAEQRSAMRFTMGGLLAKDDAMNSFLFKV